MLNIERIEKNKSKTWDCFAGRLGAHIGTFATQKAAQEALSDWHYFNPAERREEREALVYHIVQILREAYDAGAVEDGFDRVMRSYGGAR